MTVWKSMVQVLITAITFKNSGLRHAEHPVFPYSQLSLHLMNRKVMKLKTSWSTRQTISIVIWSLTEYVSTNLKSSHPKSLSESVAEDISISKQIQLHSVPYCQQSDNTLQSLFSLQEVQDACTHPSLKRVILKVPASCLLKPIHHTG